MSSDSCSIACGLSVLRMKFAPAALAGHACHCTPDGVIFWPMEMSDLATKMSTVATFGASLTTTGFSDRPASMAATPPAPIAMVKTTIREAFMYSFSPYN